MSQLSESEEFTPLSLLLQDSFFLGQCNLMTKIRESGILDKAILEQLRPLITESNPYFHRVPQTAYSKSSELLIEEFKFEIENSTIGRFFFYLLLGGKEIPFFRPNTYLSPLPKLLFPNECVSIYCTKALFSINDLPKIINDLRTNKDGQLHCGSSKCRHGWNKWRKSILEALEISYGFPNKVTDDLSKIEKLVKGLQAFYLYKNMKPNFRPRALFLKPFSEIFDETSLARLCIFPHQLEEMSRNVGGFGESKFLKKEDFLIRLPFEAFDAEKIAVSNQQTYKFPHCLPFKKISVLQNRKGNDDENIPMDEYGLASKNDYVLFKDLGQLLSKDIQRMQM